MIVLVTGGAGFIGSHVCDRLLAEGHDVRVLDRRDDHLPAGVDHVRADMRDPGAVAGAIRGVDAVCHQAAKVGLGNDILDIADYASDNDVGTAVLLCELARAGFAGRVVQASSMVVYGEGRYTCSEHGTVRPGPRRVADLARLAIPHHEHAVLVLGDAFEHDPGRHRPTPVDTDVAERDQDARQAEIVRQLRLDLRA